MYTRPYIIMTFIAFNKKKSHWACLVLNYMARQNPVRILLNSRLHVNNALKKHFVFRNGNRTSKTIFNCMYISYNTTTLNVLKNGSLRLSTYSLKGEKVT